MVDTLDIKISKVSKSRLAQVNFHDIPFGKVARPHRPFITARQFLTGDVVKPESQGNTLETEDVMPGSYLLFAASEFIIPPTSKKSVALTILLSLLNS